MRLRIIWKLALVLFMIYIIYQIIMMLLGHSWSIEEVILAFVMANFSWNAAMQKQIYALNSNFAEHIGEHNSIEYRLSKLENFVRKV